MNHHVNYKLRDWLRFEGACAGIISDNNRATFIVLRGDGCDRFAGRMIPPGVDIDISVMRPDDLGRRAGCFYRQRIGARWK